MHCSPKWLTKCLSRWRLLLIRFFSEIQDVKVSEKSIYKIVHQYGPITKNGILAHFQSSLTTLSRFIDSLEKKGLILIDNKDVAGGRNPVEYAINPDACYSFGAYISADIYGIGLCDMAGNIIEKTSHRFYETTTPAEVAEFFHQFITRTLPQYQIDPEKVPGVGVAVEGPILREKGILYHPYHLTKPGWEMVPLKDLLEMKTGHEVWIDCIVESALMSELVYGEHKGCTRAAYLRIDKGIGCAVYSHGIFGVGNEDFGNSLGHSVIDFQGPSCVCGRKGCLETYASMDSIVAGLQKIKPDMELQAGNAEHADEKRIWEYSSLLRPIESYQSSSEPEVIRYFERLAEVFAAAISNFLYFTRPHVLFWAGRTVKQLPAIFENVTERIQQHYDRNFMQNIQFTQSELDDARVIKGASFLVMNNYIEYFGKGGG